MASDAQQLLAEYVERRSEEAFRELVTRYIGLVYSAAVRLVDHERHLAEDIAQIVFIDLARLAPTLSNKVLLGGWLHRRTCHVAATLMRTERRRRIRERRTMEITAMQDHTESNLAQLASVLDEAINQLGARDRAAILLRFFEQRDLRSVGEFLGGSENAAQKRLSRALEKLRTALMRRGASLSPAALGTMVGAQTVGSAPVGLAATVSGAALAKAASAGGVGLYLLKLLAVTKLKPIAATTVVAAVIGGTLIFEQQSKVREENRALRQQIAHLAEQKKQIEPVTLSQDPSQELLKLRGEVGLLRNMKSEIEGLRAQNSDLRSALAAATQKAATPSLPKRMDPLFAIGGQVKIPARQSLVGPVTVLQAIQAAGGLTEQASKTKVILRRRGQERILSQSEIMGGKSEDPLLEPDDQVIVPAE